MRRVLLTAVAALLLVVPAAHAAFAPGDQVTISGTATSYDGRDATVLASEPTRVLVDINESDSTGNLRRYTSTQLKPKATPTPTPTPTPTATPSPTPTATPSPTPTATPSPTPTATPTPTPDPTTTRVAYDTTAPSTPGVANTMFPRPISYCSSSILLNTWEPAHGNTGYMGAGDSYGTMGWGDGDTRFSWWSSFSRWTARRSQINGHYSNGTTAHALTTTEAISFAACRWGIREDLLRAVAVQESDWHETSVGDQCASPNTVATGHGSFGITQVKNLNCADDGDWGGWPRTAQSIPFNLDTYGAAFRACLEQDFWSTIPAADSDARRERGCVGEWFSGSYNPDISYVNSVYSWLANRTWESY